MGINMLRLSGIDATTHIKTHRTETIVIGISANTENDNSDAMKRVGAADDLIAVSLPRGGGRQILGKPSVDARIAELGKSAVRRWNTECYRQSSMTVDEV